MAETKFTPGPWEAVREDKEACRVESEDYGRIVTVHDPLTPSRANADAHLIASAPDLYAVVEAAVEWAKGSYGDWEDGGMYDFLGWSRDAVAALAKARGER